MSETERAVLLRSLTTTEALAEAFSDRAVLEGMLRFETALARAEATAGVVPAAVADAIGAVAVDDFDPGTIARAARTSGTIAIAFVDTLRSRIAATAPSAVPFIHWGATSQDATDTALVLCLQRARRALAADHARLLPELRRLSEKYRHAVMLARTLLQPAAPTTFGLKAAGWLGAVSRSYTLLDQAFEGARVLQFGGPSGTLAALGDRGLSVSQAVAEELGLACPDAPWHAHRDRLASLVTACGIYTGSLGKIARDVALMMQFEVSEAAEPGGGSSSMPHKRNPAGCAVILAAATRLPGLVAAFLSGMTQEHERGVGGWHAEAPILADVVQSTGSALAATADLVEGLTVDPARMRQNLDATGGVIFAERAMTLLVPALGAEAARRAIADALSAAGQGPHAFATALLANAAVAAALTDEQTHSLDEPLAYLGTADAFRRRLLADERD